MHTLMPMTPSIRPAILLIDDDATRGRSLMRLAARAFPDTRILWARNGLRGLDLARQHAEQLRLVVLDSAMPLLDGTLTAAQIRALVPAVPVMPLTAHADAVPALLALGCVRPVIKQPDVVRELPELMRQAMATPVPPVPDGPWLRALQRSGSAVLAFVQDGSTGSMAGDGALAEQIQRALVWLDKYCARFGTPAREVLQARRLLQEACTR